MTRFYIRNIHGVAVYPLTSHLPIFVCHIAGSRQIDAWIYRLTIHIGLPMERPNYRASADRVRVGFGPFAVSWWRR